MRASAALLLASALAGCTPNPRNEIAAIAGAAVAEVARTAGGQPVCVQRTIMPWQPPGEAGRTDPPAPPGFEDLYGQTAFRGGGGVKGERIGGVAIRGGAGCFALRGPLVLGDRAMLEVHEADAGLNVWLRRVDGRWRVVMTTTSTYSRT